MPNVQPDDRPGSPDVPQSPPADTPSASAGRAWLVEQSLLVEQRLSGHLNILKSQSPPHGRVVEAVQYSLSSGGKRLRPVLVLEACRACGTDAEAAWPAALAIECIHTFSLIHDDLPAMDDDDLRRGKPTCHKVFGEAVAVLAGDWLVAHAFDLLTAADIEPRIAAGFVRSLTRGTGDMIVGQGADIAGEQLAIDPDLVRFIHRHKTARLLETACELGAIAADASNEQVAKLKEYGTHLGLAFQIVDDILDRTSTTETMGKRVGKDDEESKQTYPTAFGLEESRRQARAEIDQAVEALDEFGQSAAHLRDLARFVIERDR